MCAPVTACESFGQQAIAVAEVARGRQTDRQPDVYKHVPAPSPITNPLMQQQWPRMDGRTDGRTDRQTDRQTDRHVPAPSPMTNPSLSLSQGLDAFVGSSLRLDRARQAMNPPTPEGMTAASAPPASMRSASPL